MPETKSLVLGKQVLEPSQEKEKEKEKGRAKVRAKEMVRVTLLGPPGDWGFHQVMGKGTGRERERGRGCCQTPGLGLSAERIPP